MSAHRRLRPLPEGLTAPGHLAAPPASDSALSFRLACRLCLEVSRSGLLAQLLADCREAGERLRESEGRASGGSASGSGAAAEPWLRLAAAVLQLAHTVAAGVRQLPPASSGASAAAAAVGMEQALSSMLPHGSRARQQILVSQPRQQWTQEDKLAVAAVVIATLPDAWLRLQAAASELQASADEAPGRAGEPAGPTPEQLMAEARALATLRCANPACTNAAGASEASLRSWHCGGCGLVRYCGEACRNAAWRGHRRACRLLQADAAAQRAAGGEAAA